MRITAERLRQTTIPTPPALPYEASFADFFDRHLEPLLPDLAIVEQIHRLLLDYIREPDPVFVTRMVSGQERGEVVSTSDHTRILPSDNSPAWWLHSVMFNRVDVAAEDFAAFVGEMPTHFFKVVKFPTVSSAGWHAAHILDAKDGNTDWMSWRREDVARRFIRNIHPLNIFYVPKSDWRRVGGDSELIAFVASVYSTRYASIWSEFCDVAGTPECRSDNGTRTLRIENDEGARAASPRAASPRARMNRASWDYVLRASSVRPATELLTKHPDVEARTRELSSKLTLESFVALGDTLLNKVRLPQLEKQVGRDQVKQAILAWDLIDAGINKVYLRPSGWTGALRLLEEGSEAGLQAVRSLDIRGIATAALRVAQGPYPEANALGQK